jgi:hypothetical protein
MQKAFLLLIFSLLSVIAEGQFHPGVGVSGTSAMNKDSIAFIAWASEADINPGPQEIGIDTSGIANAGSYLNALGKAGENPTVSLGDGGSAILQFPYPIRNGEGYDFAVFENSFDGTFLELAFVEVSSDGINFFRFNASSLTDTTVGLGVFGLLEPKNLNNLAGKYPLFYGTPFDLQELSGISGLDVNAITHVKVIDVIGTINPEFCSRDGSGRIVVDPFPTPFMGGGFDLDAVGVIHHQGPSGFKNELVNSLTIYPQPAVNSLQIRLNYGATKQADFKLLSLDGRQVSSQRLCNISNEFTFNLEKVSSGMYILIGSFDGVILRKVIQVN